MTGRAELRASMQSLRRDRRIDRERERERGHRRRRGKTKALRGFRGGQLGRNVGGRPEADTRRELPNCSQSLVVTKIDAPMVVRRKRTIRETAQIPETQRNRVFACRASGNSNPNN